MTTGPTGALLMRKTIAWLPVVAVLALCGAYVAMGASNPWDFVTYYYAGLAVRTGADPYSLEALSALAGRQIELPYLYPPFTLALIYPLTYLPLAEASRVWLLFQSVLLLILLWMWSRRFLAQVPVPWLLVVTLLGFNAAALWGLRTGNVVLIETTLLWLGFSAYARGKLIAAAMLISLAGTFKLLPLAFFALIALGPGRPVRKLVAIGLGAGMVALLLSATAGLTGRWTSAIGAEPLLRAPGGEINPNTPALIANILSGAGASAEVQQWIAPAFYAAVAALVLTASRTSFRHLAAVGSRQGLIVLGTLVWLLLSPRVMVYTFVLAVAPSLYVLWRLAPSAAMRAFGSVVLIAQGLVRFLPGAPPQFLSFAPLICVAAVWLLLVVQHRRIDAADGS